MAAKERESNARELSKNKEINKLEDEVAHLKGLLNLGSDDREVLQNRQTEITEAIGDLEDKNGQLTRELERSDQKIAELEGQLVRERAIDVTICEWSMTVPIEPKERKQQSEQCR